MNRRLLTLLVLFNVISMEMDAQSVISGKVVDSLSHEPIAFANITLEDGRRGTTSNIEGNFKLSVPAGYSGLFHFSHVSYRKVKLHLGTGYNIIALQSSATVLNELTFVADENPAWQVVRQAIANKNKNSPASLTSYQYISYNKFLVTTTETDRKTDSLIDQLLHRPDSVTFTRKEKDILHFDSLTEMSHLFMSESVTEKKVINPEKEKEKLLALRISGYKSPLFTNVATDYQPFSFYDDIISLLGKDFVNPISKGTFGRYNFYLVDTTYYRADTVYIIQFEPKPDKAFNSLNGMISISTDGFAIKNVIASASDPTALTGIRIQQNYEKMDGHWFPVELNTDLDLHEYIIYGRSIKAQHRSFFHEIRINPELDRSEFGDIQVDLSAPPKDQNELLLSRYQINPLSIKELKTYEVMDSVMRKLGWLDKGLEALATQALPIGPFDIDLRKIATFNRYEDVRLGAGLLTNDRFSKVIKFGGYYGFGFRDKQSKYGGELKLTFNQNKDFFIRFSSIHDIYETGSMHNIRDGQVLGSESFRIWVSSRYDKINSHKAELGYRLFQDLHAAVSLSNMEIRPTYDYYLAVNGELKNEFTINEAGLAIRYVRDENYMSLRGRKIFLSQKFPVITLSFAKAIDLFKANGFHYSRYDFNLKHEIKHRMLGKTKLCLAAGVVAGIAPYGQLFNGRGSRSASFVVDNYFQTMGLYEFAVTQYASLFAQHNFGNVLVHKTYSKPELLVFQNIGVGSLSHPEVHQGLSLQSMEKGYLESGIGLTNLLRITYFNIGYLGVGASMFYRYGPYRLATQSDNFEYRINLGFTL